MQRYFIEVAYNGTNYSGFQIQPNAPTIQSEVEKALNVLFRQSFELTGASRTDAGVHALQNFFHFDAAASIQKHHIYNLNAILPYDIVVKGIYTVPETAHSRFDAAQRSYKYVIYQQKNPFLHQKGWYYPFKINVELLHQAASIIKEYQDFTSFSKRNTQVKTFICNLNTSLWMIESGSIVYTVSANRFLRGMVRALVSTMLKVGRGSITPQDFRSIIEKKDCTFADFSAPPHGLFLTEVFYTNLQYALTPVL